MEEKSTEISNELEGAGFPPLPRSDIPFLEDNYNFKKSIIKPEEPVQYVEDKRTGITYKVPCYTATMALGNLDKSEVIAERFDFHSIRILERYNYPTLVIRHHYMITDRVLASQAYQSNMLAAVTINQYAMRREESNDNVSGVSDEQSPLDKVRAMIKGRGGSNPAESFKSKISSTTARYQS